MGMRMMARVRCFGVSGSNFDRHKDILRGFRVTSNPGAVACDASRTHDHAALDRLVEIVTGNRVKNG